MPDIVVEVWRYLRDVWVLWPLGALAAILFWAAARMDRWQREDEEYRPTLKRIAELPEPIRFPRPEKARGHAKLETLQSRVERRKRESA